MVCCTVYTELGANPNVCCNPGDVAVGGPAAEGSGVVCVEPAPGQAEDTPPMGSSEAVAVPPLENATPAVGSGEAVPEPPPEIADAPAVGSSEEVAEPPLEVMSGDDTTETFDSATLDKVNSDYASD